MQEAPTVTFVAGSDQEADPHKIHESLGRSPLQSSQRSLLLALRQFERNDGCAAGIRQEAQKFPRGDTLTNIKAE